MGLGSRAGGLGFKAGRSLPHRTKMPKKVYNYLGPSVPLKNTLKPNMANT